MHDICTTEMKDQLYLDPIDAGEKSRICFSRIIKLGKIYTKNKYREEREEFRKN